MESRRTLYAHHQTIKPTNKMKHLLSTLAVATVMSLPTLAADFTVGDLNYDITGETTVEVAKPDISWMKNSWPSLTIEVPRRWSTKASPTT